DQRRAPVARVADKRLPASRRNKLQGENGWCRGAAASGIDRRISRAAGFSRAGRLTCDRGEENKGYNHLPRRQRPSEFRAIRARKAATTSVSEARARYEFLHGRYPGSRR